MLHVVLVKGNAQRDFKPLCQSDSPRVVPHLHPFLTHQKRLDWCGCLLNYQVGIAFESHAKSPRTHLTHNLPPVPPGLRRLARINSGALTSTNPVFDLAKTSARPLRIHKIAGDGKCMFRAIAQGLARQRGLTLFPHDEAHEADLLRQAVYDAICRGKVTREYQPALTSAKIDGPIDGYCQKLLSPTFWGGDPELLCLSRMLQTPIIVYVPDDPNRPAVSGFVPIQSYGEEFRKKHKERKARKPLRLLYVNGNHYDLLLSSS